MKVSGGNMWDFTKEQLRLGRKGQSEALLRLAWRITLDDHEHIFSQTTYRRHRASINEFYNLVAEAF